LVFSENHLYLYYVNTNPTPEEKAVIIGCYRNGTTPEQISAHLQIPYEIVEKVINEYFKNNQ